MPNGDDKPKSSKSDAPLYFFFSYARNDFDTYMKRFFRDLVKRIGGLEGVEKKHINFLDIDDIEPGDNWKAELANALKTSRVLVCLYSTWYFDRPYCGKEFNVFIKRHGDLILDADGAAEGLAKIFPLTWLPPDWLEEKKLPPPIARGIQDRHGSYPQRYMEDGLSGLAKGYKTKAYDKFLNYVAMRIIKLATEDPLPPAAEKPRLDKVKNAFAETRDNGDGRAGGATPSASGAGAAGAAVSELAGPRVSSVRYCTLSRAQAQKLGLAPDAYGEHGQGDWQPFLPGSADSVASVVKAAIWDERLDYDKDSGAGDLVDWARETQWVNKVPLVIVDPRILELDAENRSQLEAITKERDLHCAIVVPIGADDPDRRSLKGRVTDFVAEQRTDGRLESGVQVHEVVGDAGALGDAVLNAIINLWPAIALHGRVHKAASGTGPARLASLEVPGDRR